MSTKIIAAGGIIKNDEGKILFQFRRGNWDLPKGKLDEGETIEECALREVEEENVLLVEFVGVTRHYYNEMGIDVEKETHWFAMKVSGEPKLIPQIEEDILELRWVAENELEDYLSGTFDNIVEIIRKYYDKYQVN
jgi:8-oxo-dGTP pyrophosphatase MutT (NUDIX family)